MHLHIYIYTIICKYDNNDNDTNNVNDDNTNNNNDNHDSLLGSEVWGRSSEALFVVQTYARDTQMLHSSSN